MYGFTLSPDKAMFSLPTQKELKAICFQPERSKAMFFYISQKVKSSHSFLTFLFQTYFSHVLTFKPP